MNQMGKYRIYTLFFLITIVAAIFFSCSKEGAFALELQSPYGRWKFEGYASSESEQVTMVPRSPLAYYLTLNKDGTFFGTSSANVIGGKFTIDTHRGVINFSATDFYSLDKSNETNDGNLYLDRLSKVKNYRVFTNKLHFYYSDKEYLFFIKLIN